MAKTSTANNISIPAPRIHPELVQEAKKREVKKNTKARPAQQRSDRQPSVVKKPTAKAAPKAAAPKSKRVQLLSIKDASSVIDQIRIAFSVSAIGSLVGIVLGASIPLTTFMIAHHEVKEFWSFYTALVAGGLIFSANSVFFWTKAAFRSSVKALGFVVLIEGAMILSKIEWLGYLGLGILIAINAVASGANLVIKPAVPKKPSWI
ncbi:hypothetical protein M0R72_00730 [Candidatus Pacearchaeota archaeon]|jgi:hypothetical protein|nr:hypothetical protein [Candidatus Pacearchaeota archaeon]